jgi:3-oxoacyl-[acyl-carrier protein] reductase
MALGLVSRSGDDLGLERTVAQPCDVRRRADLEKVVSAVVAEFGRLDLVVVNAGVGAYGPFLELSDDQLAEIIDVNVSGAIYTLRQTLPLLLESDEPDVVMLASVSGLWGFADEAVYCASKFAQVGLLRALDAELRPKGVRCTLVCPGGVATDFAIGRGRTAGMPTLAHMMTPAEVADVVLDAIRRPRHYRVSEVTLWPMFQP